MGVIFHLVFHHLSEHGNPTFLCMRSVTDKILRPDISTRKKWTGGHPLMQKFYVGLPKPKLEAAPPPSLWSIQCDQCDQPTVTATAAGNETTDGGDSGSGSNHDNVHIGIGREAHGLSNPVCHRHVSNARNGVAEEVGSYTFPRQVVEAGVQVIVQGTVGAEAVSHAI